MKTTIFLLLCFSLMLVPACDLLKDQNQDNDAKLVCIGTYINGSETKDSVFFTEDNINWFDTTTHQLRLKDSLKLKDVQNFRKFKFYLGTDSLFTAKLALDIYSSIYNDLVLHFNDQDGNVYLEDGYPIQFVDSNSSKANKEKRAANWTRFIERLEKSGKIKP